MILRGSRLRPLVRLVVQKIALARSIPFKMEPDNIIDFQAPGEPVPARGKTQPMRSELVEQAEKIITDPPLLINVVSRRVKELNLGRPPLVTVLPRMGAADIALQEIIEGKIVVDEPED